MLKVGNEHVKGSTKKRKVKKRRVNKTLMLDWFWLEGWRERERERERESQKQHCVRKKRLNDLSYFAISMCPCILNRFSKINGFAVTRKLTDTLQFIC